MKLNLLNCTFSAVMNVQSVIPMPLKENYNLINRVIIPVITQSGVEGNFVGGKYGIGDTTYQGFISPKNYY